MDYIIPRKETEDINTSPSWLLIYGRRKTGKTFLLQHFSRYDHYFLVKKNREIFTEKETMLFHDFISLVKTALEKKKTVVIDEFQRLDESILEEIVTLHPKGKLILSGSSLRVVNKFLEAKSPFLGFFTPLRIGFIQPKNIISELCSYFPAPLVIELATFVREPWLLPLYNNEQMGKFLYSTVTRGKDIIPALIGEIFVEEERERTRIYDALISIIGAGTWNMKEIVNILYSRQLLKEPSQTHVAQYIKNLEKMYIIENIRMYKTRGNYYRQRSPIANVYYYLDSRYNITNRDSTYSETEPTIQKLCTLEIQHFIADLFAELYEGRKEYFVSPDREIDFIITRRNKLVLIGEVKWKKIIKADIDTFKKNSAFLTGKKVMICKESSLSDHEIDIIDAKALIKLIHQHK